VRSAPAWSMARAGASTPAPWCATGTPRRWPRHRASTSPACRRCRSRRAGPARCRAPARWCASAWTTPTTPPSPACPSRPSRSCSSRRRAPW